MTGFLRWIVGGVCRLTPPTRLYRLRRRLWLVAGVECAEGVSITASARFLGGHVSVGARTFVGHQVGIYGSPESLVSIGSDCDLGPRVMLLAGTHEIGTSRRAGAGRSTNIVIGDGSWIGGGVTLVGPCHIGDRCVVAAGTTVRGDVPADSLVRPHGEYEPIR